MSRNDELSKTPVPFADVSVVGFMLAESETSVFPVAICLSVSVRAFQFIPGFGLSVLTPNFTTSPCCTGFEVVNTITPSGDFCPVHPFSVLND